MTLDQLARKLSRLEEQLRLLRRELDKKIDAQGKKVQRVM